MASKSWALCCSLFSFVGVIFLVIIGLLVMFQPFYMKLGKEVTGSGPLFGSAALYGLTFIVSTTVYYRESKKENDEINRFDMVVAAAEERKPLLSK